MQMNKVVKLPAALLNKLSACHNRSEEVYGLTDGKAKLYKGRQCYYVRVPAFNWHGYLSVFEVKLYK